MDRSLDGLCDSDYFYRNGALDHWEYKTRRKGKELAFTRVSASQIENFLKCKRSWFFKSILKIPEIQKGHQALGESFHLVLEKVPKGLSYPARVDTNATPEEWDKADAMAKVALPLLPQEKPKLSIRREWQISLETYENGPQFIGYVDLAIPPGIGWPALMIPDNEIIIADYKTLSDFRYMKTPEELANSIQMMSYAKAGIQPWPGGLVEKDQALDLSEITNIPVRLVHLYARTKPPFDRRAIRDSQACVDLSQINIFWNKTLDTIREMEVVSKCGSYEDVEAGGALNGHCEAYGGCSFRDKCGIGKESTIKNLFQITKKSKEQEQGNNMSGSQILARIQAARAAQGLTSTPAAPVETGIEPKTPAPAPAVTGPISGLLAKIEAQGKGKPALGGPMAQTYGKEIGAPSAQGFAGTGELGTQMANTLGELMKLASGVIPPDAPPREQEAITRPGAVSGEVVAEEDESNGVPLPTGEHTTVVATSTGSGAIEAPKKRGRPSREEMTAREVQAQKDFEIRVEAEVAKRLGGQQVVSATDTQVNEKLIELQRALDHERVQANEYLKKSSNIDSGFTLYIDCYPVKGKSEPNSLVDFFEWIGPIASAVAESNGVKDWRLIDYKGKGLLATHIRELVRAEGLPRSMTIPTYASGADVALEILIPLAKNIVKKV